MFFKYEDGELFKAMYEINAPDYNMIIELKDTYDYPHHGWYYFDTERDAYTFFNITPPVEA
jgi:hypothetical protein